MSREAPAPFLRSYRGTRPRFASGTLMSLQEGTGTSNPPHQMTQREAVFALVPTGDPSSLRFGHPDVTTGDTVFLARLPGAAAGDICTSACISIRGALRSRRGCGRFAMVLCAPRAYRTGVGEGCRGLACCLVVECFACRHAKARRSSQNRSGQTLKLVYRTGQICVTNSRKSFTSLPCSSRPVP